MHLVPEHAKNHSFVGIKGKGGAGGVREAIKMPYGCPECKIHPKEISWVCGIILIKIIDSYCTCENERAKQREKGFSFSSPSFSVIAYSYWKEEACLISSDLRSAADKKNRVSPTFCEKKVSSRKLGHVSSPAPQTGKQINKTH